MFTVTDGALGSVPPGGGGGAPPPRTAEAAYIIKQNGELQEENRALRAELAKERARASEELRELRAEKDALEGEGDRMETSVRYLRNLQKTLSELHRDGKHLSDGYKWCSAAAERAVVAARA